MRRCGPTGRITTSPVAYPADCSLAESGCNARRHEPSSAITTCTRAAPRINWIVRASSPLKRSHARNFLRERRQAKGTEFIEELVARIWAVRQAFLGKHHSRACRLPMANQHRQNSRRTAFENSSRAWRYCNTRRARKLCLDGVSYGESRDVQARIFRTGGPPPNTVFNGSTQASWFTALPASPLSHLRPKIKSA
jgi:hypothetical protein